MPPINRYGVRKPSNRDYINQAPPIKHGSQRPKERAEEKAVQELEDYQGEPDEPDRPSVQAERCRRLQDAWAAVTPGMQQSYIQNSQARAVKKHRQCELELLDVQMRLNQVR